MIDWLLARIGAISLHTHRQELLKYIEQRDALFFEVQRYRQPNHPKETISKVAGSLSNKDAENLNEVPYKCVICGGKGNFMVPGESIQGTNDYAAIEKECHACKGTGVLWG